MNKYILDNPIYVVRTDNNEDFYSFLKYSKDAEYYYDIINSQNIYQLKSLYDFLYNHTKKCSVLLNNEGLRVFSEVETLDEELKRFINGDIIREIFIINLMRRYFK